MSRRPPRSTLDRSSAAADVYKRQDVFDDARIQVADLSAQQDFEAGWGPAGAVCVRHVRVKNNVTLEQLEAHYPALRGRVGVVCTEAFALSLIPISEPTRPY